MRKFEFWLPIGLEITAVDEHDLDKEIEKLLIRLTSVEGVINVETNTLEFDNVVWSEGEEV